MARKNRISIPNGVYYVTTRIAHGAMLLRGDKLKEKICHKIYGVAKFCGVEIYAWCIMDNHIHLLVHVPNVPERFWLDPQSEPESYAFGMRPIECRAPLWPKADDVPIPILPRAPLGFMLDDAEFEIRLSGLYGKNGAHKIINRWSTALASNLDAVVQDEKMRLCRRMYNISQYMKTLKEQINIILSKEIEHKGTFWQGRFYSSLVEDTSRVMSIVAAYIDYNPVKAKLVNNPSSWKWNSYSCALGTGEYSEYCRAMYAKMFDCSWQEAKERINAIFADKLPEDLSEENVRSICDYYDEDAVKLEYYKTHKHHKDDEKTTPWKRNIRASQVIRIKTKIFKGAFIGSVNFALKTLMFLPAKYPTHSTRSAKRCNAVNWRSPIVA